MTLKAGSILLFALTLWGQACLANDDKDSVACRFYFPVGKTNVDLNYHNNAASLDTLLSQMRALEHKATVERINITASASPDGSQKTNTRVSNQRLAGLKSLLKERLSLPDSLFTTVFAGIDWEGLCALLATSDMPHADEAVRVIRNTPVFVIKNGVVVDSRNRQLMMLRGGRSWNYMKQHLYPQLRNASVISVRYTPKPMELPAAPKDTLPPIPVVEETIAARDTLPEVEAPDTIAPAPVAPAPVVEKTRKPFYMAVKSNLLYDAIIVPNLSAEFSLGKGWSLHGTWQYAWWHYLNEYTPYFWRLYGGELGVRKYFGKQAAIKPLQGHHLGIYVQALTYDIQLGGGKGMIGGQPGGTLWDKQGHGGGIEYGFSLPIRRRLNLDFSLGVGYFGGEYYEYTTENGLNIWQATKKRYYFGPTKLEASLVWLIGHGNVNEGKKGLKKGGHK